MKMPPQDAAAAAGTDAAGVAGKGRGPSKTSTPRERDSHRDDDDAEGSGVARITALRTDETCIQHKRRRSGKNRRENVVNVFNIFPLKYVDKGNTFNFQEEN